MEWIIVKRLWLLFSTFWTLVYLMYLSEANTSGPWIATLICIIIFCIIICCVRVMEIESLALTLGIIVCLGIVQLIILRKTETPYYWKYDGVNYRLLTVFFDQGVYWFIGRVVSKPFEVCFETKAKNLFYSSKWQLKNQIDALQDIAHEIENLNGSYKATDDLVSLLSIITDNTLENAYISARTKKDANVLASIADISSRYCLNINTKEKTLSTISIDITNMTQDKTELLEEITKETFSRKDCRYLKEISEMIKNEC
ncbi:MAG: hypothetical protein HDR14_07675 [Lachnospiraceae bacterium]|nr:hypothetical protein [Lachnospiraceae bacterium]